MSKKKLTADEVEKSLTDTIMNLQMQFDSSREEYIQKIKKLEEAKKEKETEIDDLKEKLVAKKNKEDQALIESFRQEREMINKELSLKVQELSSALSTNSTLTNQIDDQKRKMMDLEMDKKNLNKSIEERDDKIKELQNQISVLEQRIVDKNEENKKLENKIKEKDKNTEELNNLINDLNDKIKKAEEQNNTLLKYVKEMRENEEKLLKEKKDMDEERKKLDILKKELENNKKMEKKKSEIEKIIIKEENKPQEEIKDLNLLEQENIIIDLLCELLLKLNNLQYYISLFDLIEELLKKYDEIKYIYSLNSSTHESMNDILYSFYEFFKSYIFISQKNANLNDFLLQKNFKLTKMNKEDIEIIKKIYNIKFSHNSNILDVYRKKRELFFKSKEFTFNVLREKVLEDEKKHNENLGEGLDKNEIEFLKILKPPLELDVNFDKLINQDYVLVKYQVHNVFSQLRELTINVSNIPNFLVYSLIINCPDLLVLKIIFIKSESNSEINNNNISKLNNVCPILINHLKNLQSFSLINLPLLKNDLLSLIESIKSANIKKLSINNCFQNKEDFNSFLPVFSTDKISDIDLSHHNFHIPSLLNTSILNLNLKRKITSIRFSNSELNEDDIKIISNFVASSETLILLDIGKNILSPLACSTFGYCISRANSLENLIINECGITGENLLFIFNGKGSKSLKHINLNGNEFGDIGLVSISAFMKNSPELESIELEKCGGTDMGFPSLVNMIQSNINCKIKYVNFHKNNLTIASLDILKKFNETFTKRKLVFALDQIEGNENYMDINCAIFT